MTLRTSLLCSILAAVPCLVRGESAADAQLRARLAGCLRQGFAAPERRLCADSLEVRVLTGHDDPSPELQKLSDQVYRFLAAYDKKPQGGELPSRFDSLAAALGEDAGALKPRYFPQTQAAPAALPKAAAERRLTDEKKAAVEKRLRGLSQAFGTTADPGATPTAGPTRSASARLHAAARKPAASPTAVPQPQWPQPSLAERAKDRLQQLWSSARSASPESRAQLGLKVVRWASLAVAGAGVVVVLATSAPLVGLAMIVAGVGAYAVTSIDAGLYGHISSALERVRIRR